MQRRRRTSDLLRNRHYCRPARWIILLVIQHHPDRTFANLRCKFVRCLVHKGSFYSRVGASGNPGAVQSPKSGMAKALTYGRKRWDALTRYLGEGMAEMDNNIAERSIRSIAIGRKNWLFTGSKAGGTRAAAIYSVIGTCQLNGVEPQAYITDVIEKIASDWPASRWDELMPWNWTDDNKRTRQAA